MESNTLNENGETLETVQENTQEEAVTAAPADNTDASVTDAATGTNEAGESEPAQTKQGNPSGSSFKDRMKSVLSKCFVYENTKKTKIMLAIRIVLFVALLVVFFMNQELYCTIKKGKVTKVIYARIIKVVLASIVCTVLPMVKLKLPKRAVFSVQCLSIITTMIIALHEGENVFGRYWRDLKLTPIMFNLLIMFGIFTAVYIVSNRQKLGVLSIYGLTVLFAVVNYYVDQFRGSEITAGDLYSIGTAMNVMDEYKVKLTWEVFEAILGIPVLFSVLTFLPAERKRVKGWKRFFYIVPGTLLVIWIFSIFTRSTYPLEQGIKVKTFNPTKTYKQNGQLLNFVRGFYYMQVFPPEDYSAEMAKEVMESSGYVSDSADNDDGQQNPNIIFVMNEALWDFTWFEGNELSEDPFEYIHSLAGQDNAIIGKLDVDVFGGRTAISEYEAMTGNSAAFFPADAVPYTLYVDDTLPSINWNLKDAGYSGDIAFHPYKASGYNRPNAYPLLGFDDFVTLEDIKDELTDSDYIRKYVSDSTDFKKVISLYEEAKKTSDAPFYLFNITMQNHGGFSEDYDNLTASVETGGKLSAFNTYNRYVKLAYNSDKAFKVLTDYFEKIDEPTIIVMFGDHLPSLGSDYFKAHLGKTKSQMDSYGLFQYFETPLVIWANYDINKDGRYNERFDNISVNYLSSMIMDIAGVPMTAYQKFLVDMAEVIPQFTEHGYIDGEGVFYETDNAESPHFVDWVNKYHIFEYNNQFDDGNRINSFFMLKSDSNAMLKYDD